MIKRAFTYDKKTGMCVSRIIIDDDCIDKDFDYSDSDTGIFFVDDGCDYSCSAVWFPSDLLTLRSDSPTTISADFVPADGETPVILQAIAGTLTVGREAYEIEAGEIELTFDTPGEYRIRLDAFPYLPFEAVIHAY